MKRIKIMMSSYNGEKYIEEQIKSILTQENVQVELFIRDDGSKDSTVKIIEKLSSLYPNIHLYAFDNKGPSDSFMELLYTHEGEKKYDYYAFSDQDDIWQKDKLNRAVTFLENEIKPALYYSALLTFQEKTGEQRLIVNEREYSFVETFFQSHYPGCTMVMNAAGMELIHSITKPAVTVMHDLFLVQVFMGTDSKIIYDKESRINYRIHGSNVSVKKDSFIGEIKRYKKIFDKQKGLRLASAMAYKEVMNKLLSQDKLGVLDIITKYKGSFHEKKRLIRMIEHTGFNRKIKFLYTIAVVIGFY